MNSVEIEGAARRLDTWKEIGAFFGRDERTVKRWEAERGLPVHRLPGSGRSKVYAYADELKAWLNDGADARLFEDRAEPSSPEKAQSDPPQPIAVEPADVKPAPAMVHPRRIGVWVVASVVLLACATLALPLWRGGAGRPPAHHRLAPHSREAVELYREGMHDWNTRTPEGLHMAVDEFTQAIVREPDYAEAYVGLANCYNLLREYTSMTPQEAYPQAKAAALRAIQLDDTLAGGHLALAFEQFFWEWNGTVANREYQKALALDPNSASAHHWYANFLRLFGLHEAALAEINRAQELDPVSSAILADRARILQDGGGRDEPIRLLQQIEQINPAYLSPHLELADLYLDGGDAADFVRESNTAAALVHDDAETAVAAAAERGWRSGGVKGMLRAMLDAQLQLQARGQIRAYEVARTYARLGDDAHALSFLALAEAHHDSNFIGIGIDPAFNRLHGLARYARLLQALTARGAPVYRSSAAG